MREGSGTSRWYNSHMLPNRSAGVDRTAFRAVPWEEHFAGHEAGLLEYWLSQPVRARIDAATRCRRRVNGTLPPLDRSHFRLVDFADIDR